MVALVSLAEAKKHLRVEHQDDDADIYMKAEQATEIVVDYLKKPDHGWTHADVPFRVNAAILLVLTALYDDRDKAEMLRGLADGDRGNPVVGLLYRMRDPAIA